MERSWLVPSMLMTVVMGAVALAITPDHSGILPALQMLPLWLSASAAVGCVYVYTRMLLTGEKEPFAYLKRSVQVEWRALLLVVFGTTLAGLNMVTFMWTKPLLNHFVPFWADPLLAASDRLLFLGHDPWTFLDWLNSMPMAIFYHRGWFAMMILILLLVLSRAPSVQKSALMLTYFLLWSVAGPLIHVLLPAAGPVFYAKLGYGEDFAGIYLPDDMVRMTDYLWNSYSSGGFGPGSGISAMPSLHIATTVWMVLAVFVLARRWTSLVALPSALIFLLSISLGWHYAADGIVGGLAAVGCYRLCLRVFEGERKVLLHPAHSTGIQQA